MSNPSEIQRADLDVLEKEVRAAVQLIEHSKHNIKTAQIKLREYVTSEDFPLDKRFEIWSKHCEKRQHTYISSDVPEIVREASDDYNFCYWDRYRTMDWKNFLDLTIDMEKDVDEYKRQAIATNFGSMTLDW